MNESQRSEAGVGSGAVPPELAEADASCTFGPSFFIGQLRAFIRGRCPDPSESLPSVQIHLAEGEVVDVCHIMGLAPRWLAIAAIETARPASAPAMRTELIPYGLISRITVRPVRPEPGHVGFECDHEMRVLPGRELPEEVFLAMAGTRQTPRRSPKGTLPHARGRPNET